MAAFTAARYDPTASTAVPSSSAGPTAGGADEQAALQSLQEKIKARKRKREQEEGQTNGKGKGKSVDTAQDDGLTAGDVTLEPSSSALPDQSNAFKQQKGILKNSTDAASAPANGKEKTKAKKRYLKKKLERRKANKQKERVAAKSSGNNGNDDEGSDVDESALLNGDETMEVDLRDEEQGVQNPSSAPLETPAETKEERKARKKAKRAESRSEGLQEPMPVGEDPTAAAVTEQEKRRQERKAKKEAKRLAARDAEASLHPDTSIIVENSETAAPLNKREELHEAKLKAIKADQERSLRRAQAKAKYAPETQDQQESVVEEQPTQPDALPRFPQPTKPALPQQKDLDALTISHQLKDAVLVNQQQTVAITELAERVGLSAGMQARLKDAGLENFFAVQQEVIPLLLKERQLYTQKELRDVCVSAPTGSGKTLGYVVPIVEILSTRIITRLRALIVLPTRDLVTQVREVFEQFSKGSGLKIGVATGQHSFSHEQSALVEGDSSELKGGSSRVDILIVTPGRLMDHLKSTPGFTLQHLRFLVIDEADRLLNQSFNDWLRIVLANIERTTLPEDDEENLSSSTATEGEELILSPDAVAPALLASSFAFPPTDLDRTAVCQTQKLLFSATLTRDPSKVEALHLRDPVYLAITEGRKKNSSEKKEIAEGEAVDQGADGADDEEMDVDAILDTERRFALPATLTEHMIVTSSLSKPLILFHLLYTLSISSILIFTKSVESSSRLVRLLEFFDEEFGKIRRERSAEGPRKISVRDYSSDLKNSERKEVLTDFNNGSVQVIVCSDLIARGMDLPAVNHVVNYDVPVDMRKYVHRVGRTARAGRKGDAWSLVESQEASYFKALLRKAGRLEQVKKLKVKDSDTESFQDAYAIALNRLSVLYSRD